MIPVKFDPVNPLHRAAVLRMESSVPHGWPVSNVIATLLHEEFHAWCFMNEDQDVVLAWVLFESATDFAKIHRFIVHPEYLREGIGAEVCTELQKLLKPEPRRKLQMFVRETNLNMQLFLAAQGWLFVRFDENEFESEPAYVFEIYDMDPWPAEERIPAKQANTPGRKLKPEDLWDPSEDEFFDAEDDWDPLDLFSDEGDQNP